MDGRLDVIPFNNFILINYDFYSETFKKIYEHRNYVVISLIIYENCMFLK